MAAQLHRLLPLLLLFTWPFLLPRDGAAPPAQALHGPEDDDAGDVVHPVVLLPGAGCSQVDARLTEVYDPPVALQRRCDARKGRGWFRLWRNRTAMEADAPCYANQLRLAYDPVRGDYGSAEAGVETCVVSFGTTRGFGSDDDPSEKNICMKKLVEALEALGYKEGANLFGAPYDPRYAPAPPGMASTVFTSFFADLTLLAERASKRNGGKPVILVTHSRGGLVAVQFLNRRPVPWRRKFIKHLVFISLGAGGLVAPLLNLAACSAAADASSGYSLADAERSFESRLTPLPSPTVFGDTPLVVTGRRNYSARDIPELLTAFGFSDNEVDLYRTRTLPMTMSFSAPLVPMTAISGVGVPTPERLAYWNDDFCVEPEVVYGDGDGVVNLRSVLALDTVVGDDPGQGYFKSVLIANATHDGIVADEFALKLVVSEIVEANRAIYN